MDSIVETRPQSIPAIFPYYPEVNCFYRFPDKDSTQYHLVCAFRLSWQYQLAPNNTWSRSGFSDT